jgi:hypothetical protein
MSSSSFASQVKTLFSDIYGVRATMEWDFVAYSKFGKKWQMVSEGKAVGLTTDEAIESLIKRGILMINDRIMIGGKTYRIWFTAAGEAWTVVDRTPRGRKGDRARAREAQAARLRAS